MMPRDFFLGVHHANWLTDYRFTQISLFISRRVLSKYRSLPVAKTNFALDSGGFTELQLYGRWITSAESYIHECSRYVNFYGDRLLWIAPQDWMCEPAVIHGGHGFQGTRLSIAEHQRRTVANFLTLKNSVIGKKVIPVLQGWTMSDYLICRDMYEAQGVVLKDERVVGVGSVCRRQGTSEVDEIMTVLAACGIRIHAFGLKTEGLKKCHRILKSADSMAWSLAARKANILLDGHGLPGPGVSRGHKNCANCADWAILWYEAIGQALDGVGT